MFSAFRRASALLVAALIVAVAAGCSSSSNKPKQAPPISQADADDMVQQVAMMASLDKGGWLMDIDPTLATMPPPTQPGLLMASFSPPRFGVNHDTVVTIAGVTANITFLYSDTSATDSSIWFPGAITVDASSNATGQIVSDTTFTAAYRHSGDPITADGFEAGSDSISFTGVGDDSIYTSFTPKFRGGTAVRYATVGFTDFEFDALRNRSNPFPVNGEANIFLFGDRLRSPDPNDIETTVEASVTIYFDGTQTPVVGITNNEDDPTPQFRYKIDLRTGVITRL